MADQIEEYTIKYEFLEAPDHGERGTAGVCGEKGVADTMENGPGSTSSDSGKDGIYTGR